MPRWLLAIALTLVFSSTTRAQSWGDLTLRIVYGSDKLPAPAPIADAAGAVFCGGLGLKADNLLVNPKDRGVANAFVYLFEADPAKVPVHPSYAKSAADEVKMANKGCAFVPKAVGMRIGQTFIGENPDPVGHNMKFEPFDNLAFNLAIPAGGSITRTFTKAETTPVAMTCGSHKWMAGYVLIREDPYFAVSDASGKVKIANLPAGKWNFRIWHGAFISKAKLGGKPVEWPRGRITWEIKPGPNDLGDILVPPEAFK